MKQMELALSKIIKKQMLARAIKCFILLFLYMMTALPYLKAQKYRAEVVYTLNINNGLADNRVTGMVKDHLGYVWISTEGNLVRFDGNNIFSYTHENTPEYFRDNRADGLKYYKGYIFIYSQSGGCLRMDPENGEVMRMCSRGILDLEIVGGNLYVLFAAGYLEGIRNKKVFARRKFNRVREMDMINHKGQLIINSTEANIQALDTATLANKQPYEVLGYQGFGRLSTSSKGELLFHDGTFVKILMDDYITRLHKVSAEKGAIYHYAENKKGEKRIFYYGRELLIEHKKEWLRVPAKELGNAGISFLLDITDNCLMVGGSQGAYLISIKPVLSEPLNDIHVEQRATYRERRKIIDPGNGKIYLLGHPGLYIYDKKSKAIQSVKLPIQTNQDRAETYTVETKQGKKNKIKPKNTSKQVSTYGGVLNGNKLYICGGNNLVFEFNTKTNAVKPLIKTPDNNNAAICIKDSILLIGGSGNISKYNLKQNNAKNIPVEGNVIYDLYYDEALNQVFYATKNGLLHAEPNKLENQNQLLETDIKEECRVLFKNKKTGMLWVATKRGICIYNPVTLKKIFYLKSPKFLTDGRVTALLEDHLGRIWASTYNGITVIDPQKRELYKIYPSNGLYNTEYNYYSAAVLSDGRLMFGGMEAYDIINPNLSEDLNNKNDIKISAIGYKSNGRTKVILNENAEELSFETGKEALYIYLREEKFFVNENKMVYRLNEGDWKNIEHHNPIIFSDFKPGNYPLEIKFQNYFGQEVPIKSVYLKVTLPFYKRRFFYSSMLAVFFMMLFLIFYIRNKKNKEKIALKERISMDLHDEVGTVLTRVSMLTGKMPQNEASEDIKDSAREAFHSLRAFMQSLDDKAQTFEDFEDEMREFILNQLKHTDKIWTQHYSSDKTYILKPELFRDLKLSVYEITTNSIKHSVSKNIQYVFSAEKNKISIKLTETDTGELGELKNKEGRGIINLMKRTKRHNGLCIISAQNNELITLLTFNIT